MPFSDVCGSCSFDRCSEFPVTCNAFLGFVARSRGALVLVVAGVPHLCVLARLDEVDDLSQVMRGRAAAVGVVAQVRVVCVRISSGGEAVRKLHAGVGLEKRAQARVCSIEVGVVPWSGESAEMVSLSTGGQPVSSHDAAASHESIL